MMARAGTPWRVEILSSVSPGATVSIGPGFSGGTGGLEPSATASSEGSVTGRRAATRDTSTGDGGSTISMNLLSNKSPLPNGEGMQAAVARSTVVIEAAPIRGATSFVSRMLPII